VLPPASVFVSRNADDVKDLHVMFAVLAIQTFIDEQKVMRQLELQQDGGLQGEPPEQPDEEMPELEEMNHNPAANGNTGKGDAAQYEEQISTVRTTKAI
jgi:hypothetical protein